MSWFGFRPCQVRNSPLKSQQEDLFCSKVPVAWFKSNRALSSFNMPNPLASAGSDHGRGCQAQHQGAFRVCRGLESLESVALCWESWIDEGLWVKSYLIHDIHASTFVTFWGGLYCKVWLLGPRAIATTSQHPPFSVGFLHASRRIAGWCCTARPGNFGNTMVVSGGVQNHPIIREYCQASLRTLGTLEPCKPFNIMECNKAFRA